jgi:hypothetical protein
MMIFESMIQSILMYGAEIWRWKEQEERRRVSESGRKIFERGARNGQRNDKLHSEGRRCLKTKWMEGKSAGY